MKRLINLWIFIYAAWMTRNTNGGKYYYLASNCVGTKIKVEEAYDYGHSLENKRFEIGNYFTSKELAAKVKINISNIFKIN